MTETPTVFTRIIRGELPGRFVWRDDSAVAFLSINPLQPGHTLVVPIAEIDHWIDLPAGLWAHLSEVSRSIAVTLAEVFQPVKVGMMLAGLEVAHCHVHLVPIRGVHDLDFANADPSPDPAALDAAAERIRSALRDRGFVEAVG
ncbi:MAG: putative HIT-like protein [Acidimicrobiales bacterium]|nr:MAG: HIT family protein [Actinomycetota bacterium]MBV6507185.1 putative HIT-like protein [Acidimicrobiales bacterium]RIK05524.1 MAG: diadenosine tetraphosphate hydrolase [Acidobacteriota bacterium]